MSDLGAICLKEEGMEVFSNLDLAALGWGAGLISDVDATKADAKEANTESTYETAPERGNFWDAAMCSLGRGIYFWSDGTCEYGTGPTWRR